MSGSVEQSTGGPGDIPARRELENLWVGYRSSAADRHRCVPTVPEELFYVPRPPELRWNSLGRSIAEEFGRDRSEKGDLRWHV